MAPTPAAAGSPLRRRAREVAAGLEAAASADVAGLLGPLAAADRRAVVGAMARIERLLGAPAAPPLVVLRAPEPGDLGWIVERHAALYAREYGFDASFEALVARIVAGFAESHDPLAERAWIAELDGESVGSVMVVRAEAETAKLRLLLVEPGARGLGLGRRLVEEAVHFARAVGYRRMTLWTQADLLAARGIYAATGFRLTAAEAGHSFGRDLVSETWERDL